MNRIWRALGILHVVVGERKFRWQEGQICEQEGCQSGLARSVDENNDSRETLNEGSWRNWAVRI